MIVAIIGANGLLGSACLRILNTRPEIQVVGTFRESYDPGIFFHTREQHYVLTNALDTDQLEQFFRATRPSVVINCASLPKSKLLLGKATEFIPIYCMLPNLLADYCDRFSARLIQISSDGVFSGKRGDYSEIDVPDAADLYGRAKILGEIERPNSVTLRTSMLGHDAKMQNGLVSWFLSQTGSCSGFSNAIFSGFPVTVLARIIRDFILVNSELSGIYHVASKPISKLNLLELISKVYQHDIKIIPDDSIKINRSLNASRFNRETGFQPESWPDMIKVMRDDYFQAAGKASN